MVLIYIENDDGDNDGAAYEGDSLKVEWFPVLHQLGSNVSAITLKISVRQDGSMIV